jgi:hypothetical protein
MSLSKLTKKIYSEDIISSDKPLLWTPVLIGDSKCKYLRSCVSSNISKAIEFRCKGGVKSSETLAWVHKNLDELCKKFGKVSLYVWAETCGLTVKRGKYISLINKSDQAKDKPYFYFPSNKRIG